MSMRMQVVIPIVVTAMAFAGCATNTQNQNRAIGTATGAVFGGVIGKQIGGGTGSAVVGAALGGAFGYLAGSKVKVTERPDGSVKLDIPGSVLFSTDSAAISPAFEQTLDRIAVTLNEHPTTTVNVVGHTDMQGSLMHNMSLSRGRAEAVAQALASDYGIEPTRLEGHGVGPLAPQASNASDGGRAKNRRVVLVAR